MALAVQLERRFRMRLTTTSRLAITFSVLLAVFVSALAFDLRGLRRMQATLAAMEHQEQQVRRALDLAGAVRDQYRQLASFVPGASGDAGGYGEARSRASELTRTLREHLVEPEMAAWLAEIEQASADLDRDAREQLATPPPSGETAAVFAQERAYRSVSLVESRVNQILGRLHQVTASVCDELIALQKVALWWTAILLVAAPLLVTAGAMYLSRSISRPLARLRDAAAAVGSGDLTSRVRIDSPDEFGTLAAEFNAMAAALQRHEERLVESEKLAGIGRLAAGVAHEINNPLQVMLGYLSLQRDVSDPRLAEQLAAVEQEALRCKHIVEGLLELARPQASIAADPVDLRRVCDDVAAALRVTSPFDGLRLSVAGAGIALGDPSKLRQPIFNLMKNAVEAAAPAGQVEVCVRVVDGVAEVAVSNSGTGIPPEARSRIFEPFFTTKPTGTGLGLALSRAIARANGGDITIGQGELGGAVFTLTLPRAPGEQPA